MKKQNKPSDLETQLKWNAKSTRGDLTQLDWNTAHLKSHLEIEKKLNYILTEVSANGRPGLDASLKDIYTSQSEIKEKLGVIQEAMQAELDRTAFFRAAKKMASSSWIVQFMQSKFGFVLGVTILILVLNALVYPLGAIVPALVVTIKWATKFLAGS